jgi:hypothetical protein
VPGPLWTWNARRRGVLSSDGWVDAVIIEVDGRWFLTDTLVHNPGQELDRSATPVAVGRAVRRWLRERSRRPGLTGPAPSEEGWEQFCRDVVGVQASQLQHERSLFVCTRGRVFRCQGEAGALGEWVDVVDRDEAVGTLVVEQLGRQPLQSPVTARASVTQIDGAWHVMATPGLRWTKHVRAASPGALIEAAVPMLDRSEALAAADADPADRFSANTAADRALQQASWVRVSRRRDGTLLLDGDGGFVDVPPDGLEAEVAARLVSARRLTPRQAPSDVGFGPKSAWLAVRGLAVADLVDALGLVDTLPIDGADGIAWAMGEGVVVLMPVDDWTLAAGRDVMLAEDLDVVELSERLDTAVQLFRTHRVVDVHEWRWADRGTLVRSAEFEAGRDPEWMTTGEPTPGEADVGLPDLPTEDDVLAVAGEWSIDPTMLPPLDDVPAVWGRLP